MRSRDIVCSGFLILSLRDCVQPTATSYLLSSNTWNSPMKKLFRIKSFIFSLLMMLITSICVAQPAWINYNISNSLLPDNSVRSFGFEKNGVVWIGTDAGLVRLDNGNWTIYHVATPGLPWDDVRCIFIDRNNVKWFGTSLGGLVSYDDVIWTLYNTGNSPITDDFIRSFTIDTANNKWIGTGGGGGLFEADTAGVWTHYKMFSSPLMSNNIACIYVDSLTNDKYAGTINGGMLYIHEDTILTNYDIQSSGIPDNTILGIVKDDVQNFWLATAANGLAVKLNPFGWLNYSPFTSSIASYSLTSVDIDSAGVLWMGSVDAGLIKKDGLNFSNYYNLNSPLTDNHVQYMHIGPDGRIWIGTETQGVFVFDPSVISSVNEMAAINSIRVFPNPATNGFTQLQSANAIENAEIFDAAGKSVMKVKMNAMQVNIDLRDVANGVYFLKMFFGNGNVSVKKILVNKK